MKPGFVSYIRTLLTIIFLSWGVIPEVFAGCNISGNGGNPATVQCCACLVFWRFLSLMERRNRRTGRTEMFAFPSPASLVE